MSMREVYILILHHPVFDADAFKEVCAGLEEEGVPYSLQEESRLDNCIELAAMAASSSTLQVGIGIDRTGNLCVHHEKLKKEEPYLLGDLQNGRKAGKNAARLVKGLSLTL